MATGETTTRCFRRLRKAYDVSAVAVASSSSNSKRKRMSQDQHNIDEDMISSLPDDILLLILDKLDARSTVATTILSKRWLRLPRRSHTCYDFAVDDILPPRYHRVKQLWTEGNAAYEAEKAPYLATRRDATKEMKDRMQQWTRRTRPFAASIMRRYERCAMRRYVKRVDAFLLPPDGVHRTIQKLRLQTRSGGRWSECIQRWVTAAIGRWGVEDLELDIEEHRVDYNLNVLDGCQNMRVKRLVLINFKLVGLFDCLMLWRLTKLSLCKASYYGGASRILSNCVFLVDFSIRHCRSSLPTLQFNVPDSGLKKLLVDNCEFGEIYLDSLPWLETFACRGLQPTEVYYGEVPRLKHVSLDYLKTKVNPSVSNTTYPLSKFVMSMPSIESLVLQFKGPEVWIEPIALPNPLLHLKKLLIANVPMNWDIFWIVLLLLDASPALESFHVHIDNGSVKMASWLEVQAQQHLYNCLKDLIIVGFNAVGWQIGFVRHVMKASPRLRQVHLIDGHIVEDDDERVLGGLEVVQHRREWHECERSEVLADLRDGICSPQLEIILD